MPKSLFPALRRVLRDGEPVWQVCCPTCGKWADVDDDQLHGCVSMLHECGWHETYEQRRGRWRPPLSWRVMKVSVSVTPTESLR